MHQNSSTVDTFLQSLPTDRKEALISLRAVLEKNLPAGFEEVFHQNMIHFVVPFSLYPAGYHCPPRQPLPFISLASQKNFVALYHMGLYASPTLLEWFEAAYPHHSKWKLDMGKSCIRFKSPERIPYDLIGQLASKVTPKDWIDIYEKSVKR